ncbi:hypothetical protein ABBQ38_007796 [Trebouxia sp. C0009 RCD-2024]
MVESILALVQHPTLTARGQMNVFFAVCRACAPAILCTEQQQWGATAIQQHHPVNRSCRSYLYAQACSCGPPDGIGKGSADASTPGPDAGSTASARAAAPKKVRTCRSPVTQNSLLVIGPAATPGPRWRAAVKIGRAA